MTETFIAHVNGSHACYVTETGIDRRYIGCAHTGPRAAIDHAERREDTDAIRDHLRPSLDLTQHADTVQVSRSVLDCEDSGPAQNEAPGHPTPRSEPNRSTPQAGDEEGGSTPNKASGSPRRPAPTGSTPPVPVGAPDLGLVP